MDVKRVAFSSLAHVFRLNYQLTHSMFEKIGIYPGQQALLHVLAEHADPQGLSQKQIAHIMHVQPATLTVMTKRMEKSGHIHRVQDQEDRRVTRISVTEKGRKTYGQLVKIHTEITEEYFQGFSDREVAQLNEMVRQIGANLEHALEKRGIHTMCHQHDNEMNEGMK